jgi:NAD(P)-dependent dehydrogenase (short-subunit alcohol dehydrogenase family)
MRRKLPICCLRSGGVPRSRAVIRVNAVAPGPIWTPLIPSTLPEDSVSNFGKQVPMKRPGQPAELATAYVMLADPQSSYVSGATIAVTGGRPFL